MSRTIRVNEYYDLFDVKKISGTISSDVTNIEDNIENHNTYNEFRGFSNWENFYENNKTLTTPPSTYTANNIIEITGKYKAPQAINTLSIDETTGDIWCYPPNVSVPYWDRIIFRNFDYSVNIKNSTYIPYVCPVNKIVLNDGDDPTTTVYVGEISNINQANIFLRFDEYPSRSKVIFSGCDKTRNPDIEFKFGYHKGQMEPIKLNLSLSAGVPTRSITGDRTDVWNQNLDTYQISNILVSCYWCIEWIYEGESGN